jgi:hypothetical protein
VADITTLNTVTLALTRATGAVPENGGAAVANVRVTTSDGAPAVRGASGQYATSNGSAVAGSDYRAVSGTLNAPANTATGTLLGISVPIIDDAVDETNETFRINLTQATQSTIGTPASQVVTIVDNDTALLRISDVNQAEGNSGARNFLFTVTLSIPSASVVTVTYATANGTAVAPGDYTAVSGTLTFPPGQMSQTVAVPVQGNTTLEPNETFFVELSGAIGAPIAKARGVGMILNDDGSVVRINDVRQAEGQSGTTRFTFTVTLSRPSVTPVAVRYTITDGTATAGTDYEVLPAPPLVFAAGETRKTVAVAVKGDTTVEANETFFVNLVGATGATIFKEQGIGMILNDDGSLLRISDVTLPEGNAGIQPFTFVVTLTPPSANPVTVAYVAANGSALAGSDYTAVPVTLLTFTPGQTSQAVTVKVKGDTTKESNETFVVNLGGAVGASIFDGQGVGTILNDD